MDVLVGPVHFGDVYQAFHALFQLGEAAVVGEVGDAGHDAGTFRVTRLDGNPRVFAQLLQAQGYTVALAVELQDLDVDLVANVDDLGRMLDALPGHVGDVQQAVYAAQVHECAVVGEVLDDTLDLLAFLQRFQQSFTLGAVLGFQDAAAGNDNVVALLVELDDLELELFAFQVGGVANRTNVDQRTRQERADAVDVDGETALDLAVDDALDHFVGSESRFQNNPALGALGFLAGQLGLAKAVFYRVQCDVDFVTHLDGQLALFVVELLDRDDALGFQTGMDGDPVTIDVDHDAGDDGTRLHVEGFQTFFKEFCEAFAHVHTCSQRPGRARFRITSQCGQVIK